MAWPLYRMSQNLCHKLLLGYSPPLIKQKKFLSTWVQKWTGSEISTYVHVRVSFEYYIRCSNECGNEFASFPQTLLYAPNCSATWKSTIRKCFLIQTPCLMCNVIGTTVEEVKVCHLRIRVVFGLHHESNTSTHFNFSELSTSSDGLYGAVVCSRDHCLRTTHRIWVIAYPSVR
jgi:hypothetical protein